MPAIFELPLSTRRCLTPHFTPSPSSRAHFIMKEICVPFHSLFLSLSRSEYPLKLFTNFFFTLILPRAHILQSLAPLSESAYGVRWFGRTTAAFLNEKRINKRRELLALSRHSYNSAKVHKRVKGKKICASRPMEMRLGRKWKMRRKHSEKKLMNTKKGNFSPSFNFFYFFLCVGGSRRLKSIRWL